jgi:transcriptional regulator with XRE-family HTH domain
VNGEEEQRERRARLLSLRKGLAVSQAKVAESAGLALSTYSALESKKTKRSFREDVFEKVAKVLNSTPDYILFGHARASRAAGEETIPGEFSAKADSTGINPDKFRRLLKSLLEIEDPAVWDKIAAYVQDQKEYAELKRHRAQKEEEQKSESAETV